MQTQISSTTLSGPAGGGADCKPLPKAYGAPNCLCAFDAAARQQGLRGPRSFVFVGPAGAQGL